jgi:hypothetical protein
VKKGISSKKGLAIDIDWIISLGIFLIFLGVFFLSLRQLTFDPSPADSLLNNVVDGVDDFTLWQVQELPLIITSNITGTEPVLVRFRQPWTNFSFKDNTSFDHKEGKLIFVKRLEEGKNLLSLVSSTDNYSIPTTGRDLEGTDNLVTVNTKRFSAEFSNSMLLRVNHFEKERISDYNVSILGVELNTETATKETSNTELSTMHKLKFDQFNHTSFIVAGFPRIFNYINTNVKEQHNLTMSATVRNYTFFHIDNSISGTINYSKKDCTTTKSRYIDFYDSISGVSFITPEGTNLSFCAGNRTVELTLEFSITNETRYDIIFHEDNFNSTLKYVSPYRTAFGIVENLSGVSYNLFKSMNETDYKVLKENWSYPVSRDFSFVLENQSGSKVFVYEPVNPGITNVFAKKEDLFVLDKYATKKKHQLRIRGW